ncbi:MAG: ABC transporter permease [Myxococcales bacterium]|nr:ABC transporter permease [Myxococcales bacterium]
MIAQTVAMALQAIARNPLRSLLTMLGVVIGVGAVIGMVQLGEAAKKSVTEQIASLGQNLLMVHPGAGGPGPHGARGDAQPFDLDDVAALRREVPGVTVAPTAGASGLAVWGNRNWPTKITGTDNAFFTVRDWPLAQGRPFEAFELNGAAPVCVLGATVNKELFAGQPPLGERLRVGAVSCEVIGVLQSKQSMMGDDPDDFIAMPIRTVQRRLAGNTHVPMVFVSANDGRTAQAQADIEALLRERRRIGPGQADDFAVRDMKEIAARVNQSNDVLTTLLGGIAAVSLLVGGIGIMNIMLVSVTERTREIGVRMAVGARGAEVMRQFLVEAALLSTLGGLIGIGLGVGGSYLATSKLGLPYVFVPNVSLLAFVFSAGVGVVFGYVPARKAAHLDPIEALRHE